MTTEHASMHDAADDGAEILKRLVSILIATTTIIAAFAAFLQTDAGGRATKANRDAQSYAIQALGTRAAGQSQVDYGWYGAAHNWYALDTQALTAEQDKDQAAADRYLSVRDKIAALSPLLQKPYFDMTSGNLPDRRGYEADIFLEKATALSERYAVAAILNNGWNDKANTYILHLTLLAVALALYGLSTTPDDWTRWVFIGAGTLIVVTTLGWMGITVVTPVDVTPNQAIDAYAKGYALAWRYKSAEAIQSFDAAIVAAPDYANAYYERGNAHMALANDHVGEDPKAAEKELRLAAADFESARKAGKDDGSVNWNLGWSYYLLGFYPEAAGASRRALAIDPNLFAVRCNLGVTLLADGKIDEARREYASAIKIATDRVTAAKSAKKEPPSSLWWYLNACAADVDSLALRMQDQGRLWTQAPPRSDIADTPEVRQEMTRLITEIRSTSVALEYTGGPPGERPTANISTFQYGQQRVDKDGNYVYDDKDLPIYDDVPKGEFPHGIKKVGILYDYQGMIKGQKEIWKVYRNGIEDPSLRVEAEWDLEDAGTGVKALSYAYSRAFVLSGGEYTVELYIDNYLVQRGTFTIAAK